MTVQPKVHLREARPEDALAVAKVHVRSWQAGYRGLLPDEYLDGLRPEDRATRYTFGAVDPTMPFTLVAVRDGAVVGFATTGPRSESGVGELIALYVDPDHWSGGVGRALIAAARARLVRQGCTEATLHLVEGNERGARFYESDGWHADGTVIHEEVWGISLTSYQYRRPLP